jgi:hypothetical protein
MKEVLLFVKWQWRRWELWQKMFITGVFMLAVSWTLPEVYFIYVMNTAIVLVLAWTFKWAVWDNLVSSWNEYKNEKKKLFDVIKGD